MRLTRAADLGPAPERRWLSEPYVPLEEVTLVTGGRRAGKGLVCVQFAALASRGHRATWDLSPSEPLAEHEVLWVTSETSEDKPEEVRARFVAAGGVEEKLRFLFLSPFEGVDVLRSAVSEISSGRTLVVIDPLQAVLGDLTDRGARRRTESLVELARESSSTILAIRHVVKAGTSGRGRGEIADVVRSELLVGKHPADRRLVVMAQAPSSYGEGEPVAFRLEHQGEAMRLVRVQEGWDDDIDPIDLFPRPPRRRQTERRSKFDDAVDFLMEILQSESLPRPEVLRRARRRRISERTVERAADQLNVVRLPSRAGGAFAAAEWSLPRQTAPLPEASAGATLTENPPSASNRPSARFGPLALPLSARVPSAPPPSTPPRSSPPAERRRRAGTQSGAPHRGASASEPAAGECEQWVPTPMPEDPGVERFRKLELE